ncbi:MAG: Ig-like domain-containing protein, partial [Muribaculaceae bacterium]|nr:Ig-like domain-containing protein [Muribaculaceae bacterium]
NLTAARQFFFIPAASFSEQPPLSAPYRTAAVGNATITATSANGLTATCAVSVVETLPTSIELNIKDMALYVGQSETIQAIVRPASTTYPTVVWSSADNSIATVSPLGKVTGIKEGVVAITATCGNVSATCIVTVNPGSLRGHHHLP